METEPSASAATDYSPAKPVPASIVCSSMAMVFLMIAVILAYAVWTSRQLHDPKAIAQEAESAVRHGHAVTIQPSPQFPEAGR